MGGGTSHSTPRTTILHNEHAVRKVYLYSLTNDIQSPGRTGFWELLRCKKNSYEKKKRPACHGVKYLAMSSIGPKVWPVYSRFTATIAPRGSGIVAKRYLATRDDQCWQIMQESGVGTHPVGDSSDARPHSLITPS